MTEIQQQLLEILKNGYTLNSIGAYMKLSPKQVYQRINSLKAYGYNIYRKDFENGEIEFGLSSTPYTFQNEQIIYTAKDSSIFHCLIISDTHLGNNLQRIDILKAMYRYCIENDIHTIIHLGDFLNYTVEHLKEPYSNYPLDDDYNIQLSKALRAYPYNKNIINYVLLGDKDANFLKKESLDLIFKMQKQRYDILPIAYNEGLLKIKNEQISLYHPYGNVSPKFTQKINFKGHSHIAKIMNAINPGSEPRLHINVPTLSDLCFHDETTSLPAMYDATFDFNIGNGFIKKLGIDTLVYINNQFYKVDKFDYKFETTDIGPKEKAYEDKPNILVKK